MKHHSLNLLAEDDDDPMLSAVNLVDVFLVLVVALLTAVALQTQRDQQDDVTIIRHAGTLPIGASLSRSRIAQLAHDADAAVLSVGTITLNGGTADIAPPATGVIKPGIVTVG